MQTLRAAQAGVTATIPRCFISRVEIERDAIPLVRSMAFDGFSAQAIIDTIGYAGSRIAFLKRLKGLGVKHELACARAIGLGPRSPEFRALEAAAAASKSVMEGK